MAREQVKRKPAGKGGIAAPIVEGVLIRDGKRVADDAWTFLDDDDDIPAAGDIVVPQARLLAEGESILARNGGRAGVLVRADDKVEDLAPLIDRLALAAVHFPAYRDGRGFTSARLLRERLGYQGEMRAVGDVLPDLVFFMLRCGFTSFSLKGRDPEAAFAQAQATFTAAYQPAADARAPVWTLRARRSGAAS
jgi:uncharacterized protein (DUF934 family)